MSVDTVFEKGWSQRDCVIWKDGYRFLRRRAIDGPPKVIYWHCENKCGVTAITRDDSLEGKLKGKHDHPPNFEGQKVYPLLALRSFEFDF